MNFQNRTLLAVMLLQSLSALPCLAQGTAGQTRSVKSDAKAREKSKKSADSVGSAVKGGASTQIFSESNTVSQLARMGLDVSLIGSMSRGELAAFGESVAMVRESSSLKDTIRLISRCNREEDGADLIRTVPRLLSAGLKISLINESQVSDLKLFSDLVLKLQGEGNQSQIEQLIGEINSDVDRWNQYISDLQSNGVDAAAGLVDFRSRLADEAKVAFDSLTTDQRKKVASIFEGVGDSAKISSVMTNSPLMSEWIKLVDGSSLSLGNPGLQEAALIGNRLIVDRAANENQSLSIGQALTYDEMFPNGYSKELVRLIARYSGSERLVSAVEEFVSGKALNNQTLLSSVFSEGGQNTDLLGLRKVSYFVPNERNLNYAIGQGQVLFGRNVSISGESVVEGNPRVTIDVTSTNLKEADGTKAGSRMFAVTALGDAEISGTVTVKNRNSKAESTRNVVAIGAVGTFKVADRTRVLNEGRVLAVGAGKLQGKAGEQITGLHLESKGAVVVGSGKNLNLVDSSFRVSESKGKLLVYAQETASMSNTTFSGFGAGSEIFMDAKTINLSKIDFPDGSRVKLLSLYGGTADGSSGSGKYPVFGKSEAGRVNFISDVRYGGNLMDSVQTFDSHGGNVSIRKTGAQ